MDQEKDLGVIISSNLKVGDQCLETRNRAKKILGIINCNVVYKSKEVISKLYKSYVRPALEYCAQVWAPHLRHRYGGESTTLSNKDDFWLRE